MYPFDNLGRWVQSERGEGAVDKQVRSVPQVAGLVHLPEGFFWQFAVQSWWRVVHVGLVSAVVLDCLEVVIVGDYVDALDGGLGELAEEEEHDPCPSIEVPDGQFPEQEIRERIAEAQFLDTPLPPETMIPLASRMVLINILAQIGGTDLKE